MQYLWYCFSDKVIVSSSHHPETSSRVTLALLGSVFQTKKMEISVINKKHLKTNMKKKRNKNVINNTENTTNNDDSLLLKIFKFIDIVAFVVWTIATLVAFVTTIFYIFDLYPSFVNQSTGYTTISWLISSFLVVIALMSDKGSGPFDMGCLCHVFLTAPTLLMLIVSLLLPLPFTLSFVISLFGYGCLLIILFVLLFTGVIDTHIHWQ